MPQYFVVGRPAEVRNKTNNQPKIRMSAYIEVEKKSGKVVLFNNLEDAQEIAQKKGGVRPIIAVECKDELKLITMRLAEKSYTVRQAKKDSLQLKSYQLVDMQPKIAAITEIKDNLVQPKTWLQTTGQWALKVVPPVLGVTAFGLSAWYFDMTTPVINALGQAIPNNFATQLLGALGEGVLATTVVASGVWGTKRVRKAATLEKENADLRAELKIANDTLQKTENEKERMLKQKEKTLIKKEVTLTQQSAKLAKEIEKLKTAQTELSEGLDKLKKDRAEFITEQNKTIETNQQTKRHLTAKQKRLDTVEKRLNDEHRALEDKKADLKQFELELNALESEIKAQRDKIEQERNLIKTDLFAEPACGNHVDENPGSEHELDLEQGDAAAIVYGFTEQQKSSSMNSRAEEVVTPSLIEQKKPAFH